LNTVEKTLHVKSPEGEASEALDVSLRDRANTTVGLDSQLRSLIKNLVAGNSNDQNIIYATWHYLQNQEAAGITKSGSLLYQKQGIKSLLQRKA